MNLTVTAGQHGPFRWIEVQPEVDLEAVAALCPEMILGKQIAVVTYDSGPLPNTAELEGWSMDGDVAYSPVIADLEQLMSGGWDEWYVNIQRGDVQVIVLYVNWSTFTLLEAPTPAIRAQQARFWRQLAALQPETYLSSNEARSIVVTRSKALHTAAVLALQTTIV